MTFCLGMIVQEGIVGIADSRLTSGNEIISAKKISVYQQGRGSFFIMTSGLRSVRDKALTYFMRRSRAGPNLAIVSSRSSTPSRTRSGTFRERTNRRWSTVDSISISAHSLEVNWSMIASTCSI